jgi:hypothetical protein
MSQAPLLNLSIKAMNGANMTKLMVQVALKRSNRYERRKIITCEFQRP